MTRTMNPATGKKRRAGGPNIRGPIFHDFVRMKVQAELMKTGENVTDAHTLAYSLTDGVIDGASASAGIKANAFNGGVLAAIVAFFQSPEGQALLSALVQSLIAILSGN